jgi:hypothetical protein
MSYAVDHAYQVTDAGWARVDAPLCFGTRLNFASVCALAPLAPYEPVARSAHDDPEPIQAVAAHSHSLFGLAPKVCSPERSIRSGL